MLYLMIFLFLLPFLEIYSLIMVGSAIGVLPTIALVLCLSLLGAYLIREQGFAALFKARDALAKGEMPVAAMLDGVGLTVAGGLLIAPGLITEVMGFALLVPPVRRWLMQWAMTRLLGAHVLQRPARATRPRPSATTATNAGANDVIDGEFKRLDD